MELIVDDLDLNITSISIVHVCEKSKHPFGRRLSKIINKQLSKRNLINKGDMITNGDFAGSPSGWTIGDGWKTIQIPTPEPDCQMPGKKHESSL